MTKYIYRISFSPRKAADYAADRRPRHMRNQYRFDRLMRYKAELNRRLAAEGYRWRPAIEVGR